MTEPSDRTAQLAELIAELAAALAAEPPAPELVDPPVELLEIKEAPGLLGVSRGLRYEGPIKRGELLTVYIEARRLVPRSAPGAYVAALIEGAS